MQLKKVAARGLVTALAASMIGAGLVGIAQADVPAKAVLGAANVTAGQATTATITITNPAGTSNPSITAVRILPPLDAVGAPVATLTDGATATGGTGWNVARTSDLKGWKFSAKAGTTSPAPATPLTPAAKGLAQNTSATFTIPVSYARPAADTLARWRVLTSTDDGASYTDTASNGTSALVQTIRVLTVGAPTVNFVRPNLVTAGQSNRVLSYPVSYLGSGSVTVSTSASNTAGDSTPSASYVLTAADSTRTVSLTPSFPTANATARAIIAKATGVVTGGGSATALDASSAAYTVQTPATVTASACGRSVIGNFNFVPSATLTVSGTSSDNTVDAVSFDPDGVTLDYGTATTPGTATLRAARTVAKGSATTGVTFTDVKSSNPTADQTTGITYTLHGVDANGAPVLAATPTSCGALTIDVTAPVAAATLSTGIKQPTAVGQTRATADGRDVATDGTKITVAGTTTGSPASSVSCELVQYRYDNTIGGTNPATCTLTGSTFSSTITVAHFNVSTTSVRLRMTAVDAVGNGTTTLSEPLDVDTQVPGFDEAESVTVNPTTIKLTLDELTVGTFSPQEFTVTVGSTRYLVSAVTTNGRGSRTGDALGFANIITLTLNGELGEDDQPTVSYAALPFGTTPAADAAGNLLAGTVTATDRIAPATPALSTVNDQGPQLSSNTYYVNGTRPVFAVTGVSDTHTVEIYIDRDLSDTLTAGDTLVCSNVSNGDAEVLCIPGNGQAFLANDDYPLLVVARDASGNVGAAEASRLTVDTIAPTVTVTRVGNALLLNFGEIVLGRDNADDWFVTNGSGGASNPVSVTSEGSGTQRRLTFSDSDPVLAGAVSLSYAPAGAGSARYHDLAGNQLGDGAIAI